MNPSYRILSTRARTYQELLKGDLIGEMAIYRPTLKLAQRDNFKHGFFKKR